MTNRMVIVREASSQPASSSIPRAHLPLRVTEQLDLVSWVRLCPGDQNTTSPPAPSQALSRTTGLRGQHVVSYILYA